MKHRINIEEMVEDDSLLAYRWRCACGRVGEWDDVLDKRVRARVTTGGQRHMRSA